MYFQEIQNCILSLNMIHYHTIFPTVCPPLRRFQILIFWKHGKMVALLEEN